MGIYLLTAPLDGFAHRLSILRALAHGQIAVVVYQAPHAMMLASFFSGKNGALLNRR